MDAEQARFLTEFFAGMIERESATTAKVLEAVPDSGRDYGPDPKSRGQLAVCRRAMGSKVPAIYGGSADEPMGV